MNAKTLRQINQRAGRYGRWIDVNAKYYGIFYMRMMSGDIKRISAALRLSVKALKEIKKHGRCATAIRTRICPKCVAAQTIKEIGWEGK